MKTRCGCIAIGCVGLGVAVLALAGKPAEALSPFASLEKQVKTQWGGWSGDQRRLYPLFNKERKRLGDKFEEELLKFIGRDVTRHYWVSWYLTSPGYLGDQQALPQLALLILEQGIAICHGQPDRGRRNQVLRLQVYAAVISKRLGLDALARYHKVAAEEIVRKDPIVVGAWPCMSEENRKVYAAIEVKVQEKERQGR